MVSIQGSLTVFFEEPFWVAICEQLQDGALTVSRVVFGAEPREFEVYEFFLENFCKLEFSPPVSQDHLTDRAVNPKRLQREAKRMVSESGVSTKAQQAMKLLQEQNKQERKADSRRRDEAEEARKLELHRQKKKEKHKGR